MAIIVGIDEAGYGPLLGPLVITSVAFRLPEEKLRSDMWKLLENAVGKQKRKLAGRLLITDSKKAYSRSQGVLHLRRSVLAALACCDGKLLPSTTTELIDRLCPTAAGRLEWYPWYQNLSEHDLDANKADIQIAAQVLAATLKGRQMELIDMSSRCLDVGYYNKMVKAVKNKASVSFTSVCSLINDIFAKTCDLDGETLQIIVDRQGGRSRYQRVLARMFPEMEIAIIKEDNSNSSYELCCGDRRMRIHFPIKADDNFMAVALASMASKYLREVLMESLNRHFINLYKSGDSGELKPTAGYWTDGLRFINDIETKIGQLGQERAKLVRSR